MGDRYISPLTNGKVRRPYGSKKRALELIRDKSSRMTDDEYNALSQLRTYLDGAKRYIGLVASYNDNRASGTPISQQERLANRLNGEIQEEWPIYCGQKVTEAEFWVDHPQSWGVIVMVLHEDNSFVDIGLMLGAKGEKYAQEKASKLFWVGVPKIRSLYYPHAPP